MIQKIFDFIKKRPGLMILIVILSVITVVNIKPDFYLMGWDNYSSYFNLKTNIFRTFFATWRGYRGLGVPSDSEATDIFRQIFFLILDPFFKQELLDQIFSLFSFNLGVILIYLLSKKLFREIFQNNEQNLDLIGLSSGLFYIFNLNTLATFYFPMIMYINRFYTVPLLFYIFLTLLQEKITWKKLLIFSLLIIFSSGTYITATIFITVLISLGLFLFMQSQNLSKTFIFILFFLLLNSFWFFPFINYTINKSGIVYQAPTFIDANEIQLNKPASFYSLGKQLILYPNFFDTNITSFNGIQTSSIHPLGNFFNQFPYNFVLYIFPFLYLSGAIYFIFNYKKYKKILWIPMFIFLYLFLSLKAFSPLGFIYNFFEKTIPYFGSLFRFGDTKFHYFIAFAGSLSASFFVVKIIEKLYKKNLVFFFSILLLLFVVVFNSYFNGHFFGFFDLNKLPKAYFEIAKVINEDKKDFRVLHLPFNQDRYWRSYNWGYLGSSFLHFLINKPLLEKTFEPASQENIELNQKIYEKIAKKNTNDLYLLLKKIGVKYIIFDETISPQMTAKGLGAWGRYNFYESQEAINNLESKGLILKVATYDLNIIDYLNIYKKVFSLSQEDYELIEKNPNYKIGLYELKDPDPKFKLIESSQFTDPKLTEINTDPEKETLQDTTSLFESFPFRRKDLKYIIDNDRVEVKINNFELKDAKNYSVAIKTNNLKEPQTTVEIYSRVDDENLYLYFYNNPFPNIVLENQLLTSKTKIKEISIPLEKINDSLQTINNLNDFLANWNKALSYRLISGLRIKIGRDIIPFPTKINDKETYIGSLIIKENQIPIQILKINSESLIDLKNIQFTDNPNCYSDKLQDYFSNINYSNGFRLESRNGSTCFKTTLNGLIDEKAKYVEVKLDYQSRSEDLDQKFLNFKSQSKRVLSEIIRNFSKPDYLSICIKDANVDDCFNTHQILNLTSGKVIIPTDKEINAFDPIIYFALKNTGYQSKFLVINNLSVTSFKTILEDSLDIRVDDNHFNFTVDRSQRLKLSFNLPLNYYSFYQNKRDGFNVSNGLCNQPNSYRTFRMVNNKLISYFENCDNNFFQTLDFDSNNSYLWIVNYNLASGKFPRFNLGDGFNKYLNQILSLNQGYPDIKGFKEFQNPEVFPNKKDISKKLESLFLVTTSLVLPSSPTIDDQKRKNFMIAHDSENEGIAIYDNFNIIQIPNSWINLSIGTENNFYQIAQLDEIRFQKILPSLWKINSAMNGQILLFNEGYDKQWGIYGNFFDLMIGKESGRHYKCNNYANCFEIMSNSSQHYIFYTPERLYFLGWILTLFVVFFGKRIVSS